LVVLETIHTRAQSANICPAFTRDPTNRYGFLLTLDNDLFSFSLGSWIPNLEDELADPTGSGAGFRLDILLDSERTLVDRILHHQQDQFAQPVSLSACISFVDSDLGWFVCIKSAQRRGT